MTRYRVMTQLKVDVVQTVEAKSRGDAGRVAWDNIEAGRVDLGEGELNEYVTDRAFEQEDQADG